MELAHNQSDDSMSQIDGRSGVAYDTTNNRMEMQAVINAILSTPKGSRLRIFSDSGYVVNGFTLPTHLKKWVNSGWKNSKHEPVANPDLWLMLHSISQFYDINLVLIKGHGKNRNPEHNYWNGVVDKMCTEEMQKMMRVEDNINQYMEVQ